MRSGFLAGFAAAAGLAAVVAGGFAALAPGHAKPTPTPAVTYPGVASLEKARQLASAGTLDGAADALSDALREIEDKGPLRIEHLQLVRPGVNGFGLYTPIPADTLQPGDGIIVYFEPTGITHAFSGDMWHLDLSADLALLDAKGQTLEEKPGFLTQQVESHQPNREIQFVMRLLSTGMPEGDYAARITLHDRLGNKDAVATLPFHIKSS